MTQLPIEKLRDDTPGCQQVLHFNNAGAALLARPVIQAVKDHIDLETMRGGYEAARRVQEKLDKVYASAARLMACEPEEIAYFESATRAWDTAFYSFKFNPGDRILTSMSEYASNYLAFLHMAKRTGVIIDVVANDAYGQLDVDDLQNRIDHRVKLIAITHIPTQGGLINPVEEVGKIAKKNNIPYILDATQSVGHLPVNVQKIGCDFLCATGRKYLRGPRGTGFLYARKEIIEQYDPPFIDLHSASWVKDNEYLINSHAQRFESWEQNIAAKLGLGLAIDYALELGLPAIWDRIQYLATQLRQKLQAIPAIELQDLGEKKCGIVTFTCKNKSAQEIQEYLAQLNINVSVSLTEYSRLDMSSRHLSALVRASVHYYNTDNEIDLFCTAIERAKND